MMCTWKAPANGCHVWLGWGFKQKEGRSRKWRRRQMNRFLFHLFERNGVEEQRTIETIGNVNIAIIRRVQSTFLRDLYLHFNWQPFTLRAHTPLVRTCRWIFYWVVLCRSYFPVCRQLLLWKDFHAHRTGDDTEIDEKYLLRRRVLWDCDDGIHLGKAELDRRKVGPIRAFFVNEKRMMWEHFCCGHMQLQSICGGSWLAWKRSVYLIQRNGLRSDFEKSKTGNRIRNWVSDLRCRKNGWKW